LSPVLEPAGSTAAAEKLAATTKHSGLPSDAGQQAGSGETVQKRCNGTFMIDPSGPLRIISAVVTAMQ